MDPTARKLSQASPGVEVEDRESLSVCASCLSMQSVCTTGLCPCLSVGLGGSACLSLLSLCAVFLSSLSPSSLFPVCNLGEASKMPRAWHLRRHSLLAADPDLA